VIKSMTGYGRAQQIIDGRDITVEIKAVNHRYFEFSSRVPRAYGYLDDKLKSLVQKEINRGKVEVNVTINSVEGKEALIQINKAIVKGYLDALRETAEWAGLRDDLTLSSIIRLPDAFSVQKAVDDEDEICSMVLIVATVALEKFVAMRKSEGERLRDDVLSRAKAIVAHVSEIEKLSPLTVKAYHDKLFAKLSEVLSSTSIDSQRILTETAIFADKVAVDEETVRLRSHIEQLETMFMTEDAVGRKLDFIIQEINREVNTIGSKSQDLNITKTVVEMKSEIEKIREQVQNIE